MKKEGRKEGTNTERKKSLKGKEIFTVNKVLSVSSWKSSPAISNRSRMTEYKELKGEKGEQVY